MRVHSEAPLRPPPAGWGVGGTNGAPAGSQATHTEEIRAKLQFQGAEQMGQMEHLLNVYATRSARGAIADFVGYLEVRESEATMRLTQGLWLVSTPCTFLGGPGSCLQPVLLVFGAVCGVATACMHGRSCGCCIRFGLGLGWQRR